MIYFKFETNTNVVVQNNISLHTEVNWAKYLKNCSIVDLLS